MKRTTRRSALIVSCVAALTAGSAQAAAVPYTATATSVTAGSATLIGSIVSGGVATPWEFVYGSAPFVSTYTPTLILPTNSPASAVVLWQVNGLTPNTSYTFQLLTNSGTVGSATAPLAYASGGVATFRTKGPGSASVTGIKLTVKNGHVSVGMKCSSTLTCQGLVAITARHQGKKVACGSTSFSVNAGTEKTFSTHKVSGACRALLATGTPVIAHLEASFTSYQKAISKGVTLTVAQ